MEGKEARQKLLEIFGSQIKFNKDFDNHIIGLKKGMFLKSMMMRFLSGLLQAESAARMLWSGIELKKRRLFWGTKLLELLKRVGKE